LCNAIGKTCGFLLLSEPIFSLNTAIKSSQIHKRRERDLQDVDYWCRYDHLNHH
jgi:hypothetical protein